MDKKLLQQIISLMINYYLKKNLNYDYNTTLEFLKDIHINFIDLLFYNKKKNNVNKSKEIKNP